LEKTTVVLNKVDANINFDAERSAPVAPAPQHNDAADLARLRTLLRPVIMQILDDELSSYMKMKG
jgi:hypothetical protein